MIVWKIAAAAIVVLLMSSPASAAPAGKVVLAQGVDPTTLDMANQSESPASNVGRHLFDTLYERDPNLKIVPALATEMPKFVPPSAWEVKLRRGVKFHNGEDFNADSAKFTLERLANGQGKLRGSSFFAPIDRVEIVDPYTVRVHTKAPWPILDTLMGSNQASIVPPKYYRDKDTVAVSRAPEAKAGSHVLAYADKAGGTEENALYGTPDEIVRMIEALRDAGVTYVLLTIAGGVDQLRPDDRPVGLVVGDEEALRPVGVRHVHAQLAAGGGCGDEEIAGHELRRAARGEADDASPDLVHVGIDAGVEPHHQEPA
jgi:peptide/nickel transport system substrate-binding protein